MPSTEAEPPQKPKLSLLRRLYNSWATRSLAVGAVATAIDVLILLLAIAIFRGIDKACATGCTWHNPVAAMLGVTVGSTFTFFANRHFAFRDHTPKLAPQAVKFVLSTGVAMLVHAAIVWLLSNKWSVNVVVSKFIADILVFSVGQLLVLRYLVFPKRKDEPPQEPPSSIAPDEEPSYSGVR